MNGDVSLAYEVVGEGERDILITFGWIGSFASAWEHPTHRRWLERLARLGRIILWDKRGTGLSERVAPDRLPSLEERMDDMRVVLDAVASERAVLLGISEGGALSALFAATHPEREHGRYFGAHIPGARYVELPGDDHLWWVEGSGSRCWTAGGRRWRAR